MRGRVRVTPGFCLMAAVLFYMDEGVGILPWGMLAAGLHELGHLGAARLLGGRFGALELSAVGARLRMDYPGPLSYPREAAVALAGPVTNLLLGWAAARMGFFLLAGVSFGLGGFNLLPIVPLDGGQAVFSALAAIFSEETAERALALTAGGLVGILVGIGAIAAVYFGNFSLLVTGLWLLWLTLGKR